MESRATDGSMTNPSADNAKAMPPPDAAGLASALRAQLATVTGGLAPDVYANAWWDWYLNLAKEPPIQLEIMQDAMAKAADNWSFPLRPATGHPLPPAQGGAPYPRETLAPLPFHL